jgi:multisubunit Na+/H+ antiporter MnhG subunit
MVTTVLFAFAFVGAALLAYYLFPDVITRWFQIFTTARQATYAVFSLLVAFVFLGTGSTTLVLIGGFILVIAALTLVIQDPLDLGIG